ncbi:uncharacterized protein LOC105221486 [Zeugodacus cucurbitae]|uniref:uncharacterized protein LOC105221486 n=1 Tax=Zeugodacus cucurbitae TaxID=28588 RepID=UPI0023D93741|nr:uncharacterized protein LOC105221486 [Zeugodacus cucurbitae]
MLIRYVLLVIAVLCLTCCAVSGDTKPGKLTSFRPISQAEYEAILSLTDGKTVVSEGRLINGGLAALAGLTSGWVTSLRFPNIFGSFGSAHKSPNASYPLCVIRTEDAPGSEHHHEHHGHHEHHEHHSRQRRSDDSDSHESAEHEYHQHLQQHGDHSHEDVSGEHDSSIEMVWNTNKLAPVVNCIVVLREDDDDHHTTTRRPRRKRRKQRPRPVLLPVPPPPPPPSYQPTYQYPPQPQPQPQPQPPPPPPPSPAAAYPYSAAQSPYSVGPAPPPPHGSYNNPWYWPTPQYNPYYSEPSTFTGIYPPAYPDIYATTNPSAYTRNYPGAYSGSFAAPPASNNPGTYYDAPPSAYPDPPPSTYPGDSYNPQPNSYTSDYPIREIPLNRENPPSHSEPSYNYGPPPNYSSADAGQLHYSEHYNEHIRENYHSAAKSKKSASAAKVPTKPNKQKPKRTAKPRPSNDHESYESAPTKGPIRRRHTKVKRDESGIQTRSYAKIASYSESGYQPTLYPQNNYQSNYPKVSYSHALPYPAPVYVRNSIEEPSVASNTTQYRSYATEAGIQAGRQK